jgi:hypothetical protein
MNTIKPTPEQCELLLRNVVGNLKNGNVMKAGLDFVSDCNKAKIELGPLAFMLLSSTKSNEVLGIVCGYPWMPIDIQKHHNHPNKIMSYFDAI